MQVGERLGEGPLLVVFLPGCQRRRGRLRQTHAREEDRRREKLGSSLLRCPQEEEALPFLRSSPLRHWTRTFFSLLLNRPIINGSATTIPVLRGDDWRGMECPRVRQKLTR